MNFEMMVGLRYVRAKRRNRSGGGFVSFISFVSMAGIALGVMALIVVLSVMNGFQEELRTRILGVASHMQIQAFQGELSDVLPEAAQFHVFRKSCSSSWLIVPSSHLRTTAAVSCSTWRVSMAACSRCPAATSENLVPRSS